MAYEEAEIATVPATPPSFERARVLAALAHALIVSNRSEPARARSTEALAIARALGASVVAGRAMTSLGAATARLEHPDHGLSLLLEARQQLHRAGAELDFLFVTYTLESVVLEDAGRLERAYEAAREGIEFTRAHGMHRNHRGWLEATGASALIKLGRWVEAGELLETALRRGPSGITRRAAQLLRAELQLACGDLAGAAASAADGQRAVRGEQPFAGRLCDVLAALAMAHGGDFDAAREHVRHGLEVLAPLDDLHAVARLCWRGLQAEAEADRAERARATAGANEQESAAGVAATLLESARALVTSVDAAVRAAELPALRATCEAEFARATGRADPQGLGRRPWRPGKRSMSRTRGRTACSAPPRVPWPRSAPRRKRLRSWRRPAASQSRLGAAPLVAAIESLARVQSASGRTASPA